MSEGDKPNRVYLGSYEGGLHHLIVPRAAVASAEAALNAERVRREKVASETKLRAVQSARAQGKLRKLMRMVFRGHRRTPQ